MRWTLRSFFLTSPHSFTFPHSLFFILMYVVLLVLVGSACTLWFIIYRPQSLTSSARSLPPLNPICLGSCPCPRWNVNMPISSTRSGGSPSSFSPQTSILVSKLALSPRSCILVLYVVVVSSTSFSSAARTGSLCRLVFLLSDFLCNTRLRLQSHCWFSSGICSRLVIVTIWFVDFLERLFAELVNVLERCSSDHEGGRQAKSQGLLFLLFEAPSLTDRKLLNKSRPDLISRKNDGSEVRCYSPCF